MFFDFSYFFLITCQQAHHLQSKKINFLLKFCVKILFYRHFFSPRKGKRERIRIREAQKHADPADPDPDPQHCWT